MEEVDSLQDVFPSSCKHCGKAFQDTDSIEKGKYFRFQVVDIPEIKPCREEYHLHSRRRQCGAETWAEIPKHVGRGFGPRITSFAAYLTGIHRVTRRGIVDIFKTIFGIDISVGTVCNLHQEVSESLSPCYEEIKEALPQQPVLNVDETGWRNRGKSRWLWTFVNPKLAFFTVAPSRGAKTLRGILGDTFTGILCSDRFSAYSSYHKGLRQICWAHIIRDIKGIRHACRSPDAVRFSRWILREIGRMFGLFHAWRDDHLNRESLVLKSVPIRARMSNCLQTYELSRDGDVARMCRGLLKYWKHLFTFLEYEGVEPTNNPAEQCIRPAVQWRKICFGNQSQGGERLTERLLTVNRTCFLQKKNAFLHLVNSLIAHWTGLAYPSLVTASR